MSLTSRFTDLDLKFPVTGNILSGPEKSRIGKPELAIHIVAVSYYCGAILHESEVYSKIILNQDQPC